MASATSVPVAVARGAAPRPRQRDSRNRPRFGVTREFVAIGGRGRPGSTSDRGALPRARVVTVRAATADPRGGRSPSAGLAAVPRGPRGVPLPSGVHERGSRSSRFAPRASGGEGDLIATFGRYAGAALGVVGLSFVAGTLAAERTEDEDVPRMGERAASAGAPPKTSPKQTVAGGVAGANNANKKQKPMPSGVLPSKGVGKDEKAKKSANNNNVFSGMMKAASPASSRRAAPRYDWGAAEADGPREYMEDAWFVNPSGFADGYFFAGVADGHGGSASSAYLRERLFESLNAYVGGSASSLNASAPGDAPDGTPGGGYLADALDRGFVATDAKLIDHVASLGEPECWSGSTCTVALVRDDRVVCANVGDSRALLVRKHKGATSRGVELSSDHRPVGSCKTGRQELDRIVRAGGWSTGGRVCGILAVSRAFGDYEFKGGRFDLLEDLSEEPLAKKATLESPPVIPNPAVFECARSEDDEWLVLASDGLWDTVNSAQCATFIKQETKKNPDITADALADALVKRALRFRTQDNVAAVVVDLRSDE